VVAQISDADLCHALHCITRDTVMNRDGGVWFQ
jgi:hypothetical protein